MPLYECQCTACGEIEEAIQKFSDPPLKTCPHCSGKLTKLISQSSFHLKGSGWYVTDYASKPGPKEKPEKTQSAGDKTAAKTKSASTTEAASE